MIPPQAGGRRTAAGGGRWAAEAVSGQAVTQKESYVSHGAVKVVLRKAIGRSCIHD